MIYRRRRTAFTLFELILAIALSAALLALIGMAINLYLNRISTSRDRVEEAQLARSILSMIADDLRATAVYQPQDVTDVAQLMAASASFDVDSIDAARSSSGGATSASGSGGASASSGSLSGSSGTGGSGSTTLGGSNGSGSSGGGSTSAGSSTYESEMPLGINGGLSDLYLDIERLPRGDELFSTLTGYSNAPMAAAINSPTSAGGATWGSTPSPSDLRTVRYFIREGDRSNATGLAATSLAPELQGSAGGLVRQEIPRPSRLFAEQNANAAVLESGQVLIAPEVVSIEFRYFDGEQVYEAWDMVERQSLPLAIEVRIRLISAHEAAAGSYDANALLNASREYRQTVFLPMAELSQSAAAGGAGGSSSGSSSSGSTSSGSTSSGSGSSGSSSFGSGSSL